MQIYWGGTRRASLERKRKGGLAVGRAITISDLPPPVRAALADRIGANTLVAIESVSDGNGGYYEIVSRNRDGNQMIELGPDGMPRR